MDVQAESVSSGELKTGPRKRLKRKYYEAELRRLQVELTKLQDWVAREELKVVVLFEGRDAAGKGGVIKRIIQTLNPRQVRVAALAKPTRARADPVVFPALRGPSPGRRRDRPLRPELVQPGRSRAGHGVLHRRGVLGIPLLLPPSSSGCCSGPTSISSSTGSR